MASPEDALDTLDAAAGAATAVWQGDTYALPDPASIPWREVVDILEQPAALVGHLPPGLQHLAMYRLAALRDHWVAAHDIGSSQQARRLCYVLSKHSSAIEADFGRWYPGVAPYDLWRARQWRRLLNLIDHLPQHTYYHAAVAMDEEHARMIVEAERAAKARGEEPPTSAGPSMATWSPEVDKLVMLLDAVKENTYVTAKAASDKGIGSPPKPHPRPTSVLEKVRLRMRAQAHDILVRRMLPHKFEDTDT